MLATLGRLCCKTMNLRQILIILLRAHLHYVYQVTHNNTGLYSDIIYVHYYLVRQYYSY